MGCTGVQGLTLVSPTSALGSSEKTPIFTSSIRMLALVSYASGERGLIGHSQGGIPSASGDLDVRGDDAVADNLTVRVLEARVFQKVARLEGGHGQWVGRGDGSLLAAANVGAVARGAEGIIGLARHAHGIAREGGDAGALVVGSQEGGAGVSGRVDAIGVVDPDGRAILDLHGAVGVDLFNETNTALQQELGDANGCRNRATVPDEVAHDLSGVSLYSGLDGVTTYIHLIAIEGTALVGGDKVLPGDERSRKVHLEILGNLDSIAIDGNRPSRVEGRVGGRCAAGVSPQNGRAQRRLLLHTLQWRRQSRSQRLPPRR